MNIEETHMKKKIITGLSVFALALSTTIFTGCADDSYSKKQDLTQSTYKGFADGYFTTVKEWEDKFDKYKIVYANDTKVIYLVCISVNHFGITPLYNADGTLQIYGEGE